MSIEIFIPVLDISEWVAGFILCGLAVFFGVIAGVFSFDNSSTAEKLGALIVWFFVGVIIFAILNIWKVVELVPI
jgi:hypothetical protein